MVWSERRMCRGLMWTVLDQDLSTFVCSLCGLHTSLCHLLHAEGERPPYYTTMAVLLMRAVVCIASRLTALKADHSTIDYHTHVGGYDTAGSLHTFALSLTAATVKRYHNSTSYLYNKCTIMFITLEQDSNQAIPSLPSQVHFPVGCSSTFRRVRSPIS